MRSLLTIFALLFLFSGCKKQKTLTVITKNNVEFAEHLQITEIESGYIVRVMNPWPGNSQNYTWILHRGNTEIHDSLSIFPKIQIPIQKIVVTSTTHIPALEMLDKVANLVAFPNTDLVSSEMVRKRIDAGKIQDLGGGVNLNTELLLKIQPDVIVNFGVDKEHTAHKTLEKLNIQTIYNADWVEKSPLGRAEWLLLFGCLFDEFDGAQSKFKEIRNRYNSIKNRAALNPVKPTVLSGSPYEGKWYVPQGESWASNLILDAGGEYIFKDLKGSGSEVMSSENVLMLAKNAELWIAPGQFGSSEQLIQSDPLIAHFQSFKNHKIYTFSTKRGETGGVIYYEEASARPDKVLEDVVKIIQPLSLPKTPYHYFQPLR